MSNEQTKANRILHLKIKTPSPDAAKVLVSMVKSAIPLYESFGDVRIRLLRNADDQSQFVEVVEYRVDKGLELSRHKLASDPIAQNFVRAWHALFPEGIEVDVYEDVTEAL